MIWVRRKLNVMVSPRKWTMVKMLTHGNGGYAFNFCKMFPYMNL